MKGQREEERSREEMENNLKQQNGNKYTLSIIILNVT